MEHRLVLLLTLFVAGAVAGPVNYSGNQCARHCTENTKLRYESGVYTYEYESDTITTMQGTTHDESRLHLKAQVDIEVLSKCELAMRIRRTTLEYSDPRDPSSRNPAGNSEQFRTSLEKNVLRFSFQDGRIENLCPTENEEPWVLNIKKGILSAFQNSMDNLEITQSVTETDVAGNCQVEYQALGRNWRNTITVKKTRDLMSCTERYTTETALQANPYDDQPTKSLPLVEGEQICEQTFSSNILQSSSCTEKHRLRPFSRQSSGAITRTTQKLTFSSTHNSRFTGNDYRPTQDTQTKLLFNHDYEQSEDRRQAKAEEALSTLCNAAREEISAEVPRLFTRLVYTLRKLDFSQLLVVSRQAENVCKDRKFFADAVAMVGTSSSIKFMISLIESNRVSGSEVDFWLTSLAFLPNPTREMISTLTPLLDGRYDQAILGVSGLVHTFCRSHSDCGLVREVREAVQKLVANLGESCYGRDPRKVLLSLKAIGNIGQGSDAEFVLRKCYQNPQINTETRLAAIQAYRRFSCDISRDDLLKLYTNYKEDSELRIASYLAVMRCATPSTIVTIKETLEKEIVSQVGSFVWTHLLNIKESINPLKSEIKDIVSNLYLMNKYNTDIRKFSRALEGSIFSESLNMGAHVDSNIIYSPESYIPRSGMFNLTLDLFGSTVNLFEIGGRVEHLDQMVERMFGPKGYFSKGPISDIARNWRQRRSVTDNKIEEMDGMFDAKNRYNQDPYGSMYLKIFGNEMWYSNIDSLTTNTDSFDFNTFLRELAREQDIEFSKSFMFLDATYVIPTANGMPLRLAINGTASVGLKVGGKFDVRSLKQIDVRGRFQPSGAVEVSSLMTVDAGGARTGLKMVATLHSSTWLDGLIEVRNGEVAKIQLNMPRDKIEFIDVQSKIFLLHGEQEKEQKGALEGTTRMSSCSGHYTSKILGIEFCSEVSFPVSNGREDIPLFPMSGAAMGRIYARKTDKSLTSYYFEARSNKEMVGDEYIRNVLLTLNTIGSSIDRELTLHFELNQPEKSVSFKLRTPIKKFGATAKYSNIDIQKRFDVSIKVDDEEIFAIQSELRADRDANGGMYSPAIEMIGPNGRIFALTGSAHIQNGQRYSAQLNIEDLTRKPINVNVNLDVKGRERFEGQFSLSSPYLETNLQGFAQLAGSVSSKITIDYQFENTRRENIEFIAKFRDLSASSLTKYSGTLSLQCTAMPQYTTVATWEMQAANGHVENTLNLNLGDGRRSRMHTINLQEILSYSGTMANNNAVLTLKMQYPEKNINYALEMKHENTDKSFSNQLTVQYAQGRKLTLSTEGEMDNNQVKGETKVQYPGREAKLAFNANSKSSREYSAALIAQWQRGRQLTASTNFKNLGDRNKLKLEADAKFNMPRQRPISMLVSVTAASNDYSLSSDLSIGRDRYTLGGTYVTAGSFNHRITMALGMPGDSYSAEATFEGDQMRLNGNFDVKLSNYRHITGTVRATNTERSKTGFLEVAWDADRDPRRVITIETQISTIDKYEGSFSVITDQRRIRGALTSLHQGNILEGMFRTNHKMEVEWEASKKASIELKMDASLRGSRRQLTGSLSAVTPFDSYENVIFLVNHNDNRREWSSNADLKYARDKQITLYTEGMYVIDRNEKSLKAGLQLTTPYRTFDRLNVNVEFKQSAYDISAAGKVDWSYDKNIAIGASSSLVPGSTYKVGFNVTSHYEMMKLISGNVELTKSAEGFRYQADGQWDVEKVSVVVDAKQSLSRNKNTYLLTAQINTPFKGYENIFSKNTYVSQRLTYNVETENVWGYKRISGRASLSDRSRSNNNDIQAKLFLATPFHNFESFDVALSHYNDEQKFKSSAEIQHSRNRAPIIFQAEGRWTSMTDAEVKFLFTSSFENFKRISSDIVHRMSESNIRTVAELIYDDMKMTGELSGSHAGNNRAYNTEIYFQATTPFRGYEEIKASLVNNRREYSFLTILQGTLNRDISKVQNNFKMTDYLNFEEDLQVTSPYIRNIQVTIKQEHNEANLKHNTEARWGRNQRLKIEGEYENKRSRYGKDVEVKFKANTPFNSLRSVNVEGNYRSNGRNYNQKLVIEWNNSKKISVEGSLTNNRFKQMEAQGTFTSHFYGYEYIFISGKYDIVSNRKTAELTMKWDPHNNKEIIAKGFVTIEKNTGMTEVNIVTPFQDYETITFKSNYALRPEEKSAFIQYQWGWRRIIVNANHKTTDNGAEIKLSFNSPYEVAKQLSLTQGYEFGDNIISEMTTLQWNEKSIVLGAELLRDGPRASLKISFKSPFRHYEIVMFEIKGDLYSSRKSLDALFQWDVNKKYELSALYETLAVSNKVLTIAVRTPHRKYEEITLRMVYKPTDYAIEGDIEINWPRNRISLDSIVRMKNGYPNSLTLNLDSPFSPFKNVHFLAAIINEEKGIFEINSELQWESANKIEMTAFAKNTNNRYFETKLRLNTPFQEFQGGSIEGSIRNEERSLHGKLNIVTPFKSLRNLELSGSYQILENGFDYHLILNSPDRKLSITGSYNNRNLKPVEVKLNINAPFTSFKTFNVEAFVNYEDISFTEGQLIVEKGSDRHSASFRFRNQNKEMEGEIKLDSLHLYWQTLSLNYKLNYADSRNIDGVLMIETPNHIHRMNANIKNGRKEFEALVRIDSPRIFTDGVVTAIVSYTSKRNRRDVKASISDLETNHEFQASYNNDNNREISTQLTLKSDLLSFRSLDVNAKFINGNGKVMEAVGTVSTPSSTHTVESTIKNYETEKDAQIKIESPLLESHSLIITGSMRSDGYHSLEGSLSAATPSEEIRISGNMKRNEWKDFEAFVTINTPFNALRMLRIDTKFLNDNYQNIEGNLEIQSSNSNMRKLGISGKLHHSYGTEDLSVTLRLPSREYSTVGLLATVHYTPGLDTFSPRLTISLPGKRYTAYANYEHRNSETSAGLGCEWGNDNKAEIAGSIKSEKGGYNVKITVGTPFRNFESQELMAVYSLDRNRYSLGITYRNARNEILNVRGHLGYHNSANFNAELNIATPYKDFEDFVIRLKQSYRRSRLATSLDCTWSAYKKVGFSLGSDYNDTDVSGHLYITSSFDILQSLKVNYAVSRNYINKVCKAELEYNNKLLFKSETSTDLSKPSYNTNIRLDFPSLPFTVSLSFVPLPSGAEITLKTNCPSRSVSFYSVYQLTDSHFSHSVILSWDERLRRSLSYEVRITDTQTSTKEIYARLNLPIRSLEVRGKHSLLPKGCSSELDFYWDAARDPLKHLLLKLEHEDESSWQITSHNIKVTVSHPRLSKDIVATGKLSLSSSDAFGKLELEYSRHQNHNMMAEVRARNLARRNRDTHYAVYITARHPISNTDLRITGEAVNNDQEISTNLKINYLDRQRQQRLEELKAKILKLREQIDLIVKSDQKEFSLTGRMFNRDNELTLTLEEQMNRQPSVHSHFRLSRKHLNMDLNITTPDQNNLHVRAAMPQDSLHFEISHANRGRSTSDAMFHLGIVSSQILRSKLTWRPELWEEVKHALSEKRNNAEEFVIVTKDKVYAETANEINAKTHIIGQAMSQEMEPFKLDMSRDMDRLRYDVSTMNNDIYNAYRRNEFYSKTAADALVTAYEYVGECTDVVISKAAEGMQGLTNCAYDAYDYAKDCAADCYRRAARTYREYNRKLMRMWRSIKGSFNRLAESAFEQFVQLMDDIKDSAYRYMTEYAPFLETYYYDYKQRLQELYQNFINLFETFCDKINSHPYYQAAVEYYQRVLSTFDEFWRLSWYEHFDRITDAAFDYVEIGQRFHDEYLRDIYIQAYEKTSQAYRYLGIDTVVNSIAVASYQKIKSIVVDTIQECIDDFATVRTGIKYEFEPQKGRIILEIPLPSPKASLREALDITTYPEYQKLVELKEAYLSGEDYCVWDTYYKYKRYIEDSLHLPPFDTYAIVAGNQHYITFDKFHFDFVGECSYLLARDFVDGNFTVIVNYARDGRDVVRKSITIYSNNKKIDIGSDYKVTVDDAKVELPQIIGDSFVTREGSVVTVKNDRGFSIHCNFIHNLCTMYMSGFYFGKTGGLFGTYDYEPLLDTMTPQRVLVDSEDVFANTWEVGNAICKTGPNLAVMMNNDYRAMEVCKKLFDDKDSIFRPCYKLVEPMRYYEMCMRDLSRYDSSMFDEKICTSSAAYMTECNMAGVPVRMPKSCVRCTKHDGSIMNSGDVVKITDSEQVQSADVVFIVEKKACNKNAVKMLGKLAQSIEDSIQQEGYTNTRYAVVGFGGEGAFEEPHLQTSDGQEFANIRSIGSAFSALTTSGWSQSDSRTSNSVFEAIRYAASLPFRTGSIKSFLLLKCSECKAEEVKADYSEMLRTLLDGDITLHLLIEHEFEMKDNRTPRGKRVRVLGLDRRAAYTPKDVKDPELTGDRDLLAQLKIPKDFCVPLALEVNGSLFGSQMLTETKRNMYKKFTDVMSRRLAKTAKPSDCQVCECISTPDGIGKSVCQRCVSPIVADMISPDISPILYSSDMSYNDDVETKELTSPADKRSKGSKKGKGQNTD